jgi:hypothetical protein
MLERDPARGSEFAATFPTRFGRVLAEARGAIAGIAASAQRGRSVIDPETLRRLHEVYRLRIELEIETAGVLWRTAELVCAITDAVDVLNRRRPSVPPPGEPWLGDADPSTVEARHAAQQPHATGAREYGRRALTQAPAIQNGAPETGNGAPPVQRFASQIQNGPPAQGWHSNGLERYGAEAA